MSEAVLVTGAANFLGYHVIKALNARGVRPRVLIDPDAESAPGLRSLERLEIERVSGSVHDLESLSAACAGVGTLFHLHFVINLGGGPAAAAELQRGNVVATRNVLDAATGARVERIVVSSSALAVGLNPEPRPLDESADWDTFRYRLPYAESRHEAEREALARPAGGPVIVAVCPSFTMGPEDYVGAPANGLVRKMAKPWFRVTAPVGFGVLDVRDYADGALRAADRGRHGQRYILSGHDVMTRHLHRAVAEVVGNRPPRFLVVAPRWLIAPLVGALNAWSRVRGRPPKVAPALLDIWGRHAWYDTTLARSELGWQPRPLKETLADAIGG